MAASPARLPAPDRWQALAWLTLFTAFNAAIAIAIALTNIPLRANPGGTLGQLYLALALPGHFLAFGSLASAVAVALALCRRRYRALIVAAIIGQGLWLCLLLVDAKVFALYRFHLNAMVLNMVFGGALQDQVSLSAGSLVQIAAVVLAVFAAQALLAWACWHLLPPAGGRRVVLTVWVSALAVMLAGQLGSAYFDARGERAVISQWTYLPWAQPITAKRQMRALGVAVHEQPALPDPRMSELAWPLEPLRCQSHQRPNILMVVLESLRADALDAAVMPNTWALAQTARVYGRHYSTGNATRFGLFGLLYGLPGGYWQPMLAEQRGSVIFDVMQQQGYAIHLYGSAPLYSPEFDRTAFASVRDRIRTAPSKLAVAARDQWIIDAMQEDITRSSGATPWFGFVFLDGTHAPYHLPPDYPPLATPMASDINFLALDHDHDATPERNRYETAVHRADALVGELLDTLRRQGLEDTTIVLVTGDHGEEFNDLGLNYWGHNGNFSDYQLQVPFVLHWPGQDTGPQQQVSSHEDWVPTLMRHAFGCENPLQAFSTGQDLLAPAPAGPRALMVESWSQRGIRQGDSTVVFDKYGTATTLDRNYLPSPRQTPDAASVREGWDELTRFRRR